MSGNQLKFTRHVRKQKNMTHKGQEKSINRNRPKNDSDDTMRRQECLKNYKDIPYFQKSKGSHEHVEERENGSYKT